MQNLIKTSEQYQPVAKEEEINVELFTEFMKKICIWDYACISGELYLSLPNHGKEAMIKNY